MRIASGLLSCGDVASGDLPVNGGTGSGTGDADRRMQALRSLQRLLDDAFRVPGTNLRFGWDPIVGLIPWVGDVLTALLSCAIIVQAHHMRVPRVVQLRMLMNVAIDLIVGVVPLRRRCRGRRSGNRTRRTSRCSSAMRQSRSPATAGDWLFVAGVLAACLADCDGAACRAVLAGSRARGSVSQLPPCHLWYRRRHASSCCRPPTAAARARKQALSPNAQFALARAAAVARDGAPLGDVFAFVSGLYFRGKLTYALRFAAPPEPGNADRRRRRARHHAERRACAAPTPTVTHDAVRAFADGDVHQDNAALPASARAERARAAARDRAGVRRRAARQHRVAEVRRRAARASSASGCCFRSTSSAAAT